jgi:hypothetical protein
MRRVTKIAIALGFLGLASAAYGQEAPTGGMRLLGLCASSNNSWRSACDFYLIGLIDGWNSALPPSQVPFCVGDDVSGEQLRLVYLQFAQTHPEKLNLPLSFAAQLSLRLAFPCK